MSTRTSAAATGQPWPVVRTYAGSQAQRIRLPLGGVGMGGLSIGGRGQLLDLEPANAPAYGYQPRHLFFVLRTHGERSGTDQRVLEGELFDHEYEGAHGSPVPQHGLPRFRERRFHAAFPFGQLDLRDPSVPADVTIGALSPFVPGDLEASSFPGFLYRVRVTNTSSERLQIAVAGNIPAVQGADSHDAPWEQNRARLIDDERGAVLQLDPDASADPRDVRYGTLALATPGRQASSSRTAWADLLWGDALAEYWDDLYDDGALGDHEPSGRTPVGSLVLEQELEPGATAELDFVLAWHFPNRRAWVHHWHGTPLVPSDEIVGNYYATRFADAADAALALGAALPDLEPRAIAFVQELIDRQLPTPILDAGLSNLSVLNSPTTFRTADGRFYGWEGSNDTSGSCHGSCTHVWNYEYATTALFPEVAWSMRHTELVDSMDDRGLMSFRTGLPAATEGNTWGFAAADGQMGSILRLWRTWYLTGDEDQRRRLWPAAKRALEFAWIPGGWDADRDGVMEGCQHNTMDVEYYGPSPVVQSWYFAALAACAELAELEGEADFAATCRSLLERGTAWMDQHMFNGEYYVQDVRPPSSSDDIADGLRMAHVGEGGAQDLSDPDYQIGPGCASDQLAGVTMATLSGLTIPLDPEHVATAFRSIARYNHRTDFHDHVNVMRSYALGDESGLLNASYPHGGRPKRPFPYWAEVWAGLEYTAALGLLTIGEHDLALRTVADVRARYDGTRRNPFDEVECGHHYVRSMASWGLIEAWPTAPTASTTTEETHVLS